ncbi:DEAD/DEAH box helicase [Rossellomorea sp. LJF3]|uniref:DEAD/DEAH box helicase n=1 Tax=Rossellomorea sp. LJF3 TaxID=3126099 RepID=UPI00300C6CA0
MISNEIVNSIDRERLNKLIKKLKKIVLQQELFSIGVDQLTLPELRNLAEVANTLASSRNNTDKLMALDIAVSLPQVMKSKGIYLNSFLVLRKLGNYPAIKLLEEITDIQAYKKLLKGISAFEEYLFESFNEKEIVNQKYLLSNFQYKIFDLINENNAISLSAPTSAGKSFILLKYVLDFLYKKNMSSVVVYIVPTRALIKQVMNDFTDDIREFGLKDIYIGCSSEVDVLLKQPKKSSILVLTQERLYQLCSKPETKRIKIDLVIADEAHNIQSGGRGVLLERAINYVRDLYPEVKVLFSSPLVSNPEKMLSTFNVEGQQEKNQFPLVSQNVIEVKQTSKFLKVFTKIADEEVELNRINYGIKGTSRASILANVAIKLWNQRSSIIYSNEPMLSSDVARNLVMSGEFPNLNDERLEEFADFIEEYISENYELASFIRCGIAFHFGSLPPIIRSGIEDLFKGGAIKIVCCTSTLLEGLNMPAKNIFIYKPEKGQNNPMDKLNFWNLAGRAGRMGNDFSGNIICINPDTWEENPLEGERQFSITPSSEYRLTNEAQKFKEFISDRAKPSGVDDYNEQLVSLVVRNNLLGKKMIDSPYKNDDNAEDFVEIDTVSDKIINEFLPPKTLLTSLPGVVPDRLNDFWIFLMENQENYKDLLPIRPFHLYDRGYVRFKKIIKLINKYFLTDREWSEDEVKKIAITGYRWATGESLSQIIFYKKGSTRYTGKKLTSYVKNNINFLNDKIRYKMVKYTQIYTQVIIEFLETIGKKEEAEKVIKFSSYLEFGASSVAALEFMSLGLPREAAIKLAENFLPTHSEEPKFYIDWLKRTDINTIEMPSYLRKQINFVQEIL